MVISLWHCHNIANIAQNFLKTGFTLLKYKTRIAVKFPCAHKVLLFYSILRGLV